jgi:hypothetical protein
MALIIRGNQNNLSVSDDISNSDTISIGNGGTDSVGGDNSRNDTII